MRIGRPRCSGFAAPLFMVRVFRVIRGSQKWETERCSRLHIGVFCVFRGLFSLLPSPTEFLRFSCSLLLVFKDVQCMHSPRFHAAFLTLAGALPFAASSVAAAFQRPRKVPVGLELYSVREALAKDLPGTVTAVAKMGYEVVEFYSPHFSNGRPRRRRRSHAAEHARHHLPVDAQRPCLVHRRRAEESDRAESDHRQQNDRPRRPGADRRSGRMESAGGSASAAAEQLRPLGMAAGFHNHQLEWRPVDGKRPMDILAANTPKDFVLQLDVGTAVEVGTDPVAWIKANLAASAAFTARTGARGPRLHRRVR